MGKSMERKREIPQSGAGQRGLEYGGHPCCRQDEMPVDCRLEDC